MSACTLPLSHYPASSPGLMISDMDEFKFVKLPTIFPYPMGPLQSEGALLMTALACPTTYFQNNRDYLNQTHLRMVRAIHWHSLGKPQCHHPASSAKNDQQWAECALIHNHVLTNDEEEEWDAIETINDARNHLHAMNTAAPTTSLVVVYAMPDNQSILMLDSALKEL